MKELKDYLHLYLGCQFVMKINGTERLTAQMNFGADALNASLDSKEPITPILILRPLSNMDAIERSKYEAKFKEGEWGTYFDADQCESPKAHVPFSIMAEIINCLRKDEFDCDGLIAAGIAIDKTNLTTSQSKTNNNG